MEKMKNTVRAPESIFKNDKESVATSVVMENTARGARAVSEARNMGEEIQNIAEQYKNCRTECTAGRIAEKLHEGTFNMDAARKGHRDLHARTTASKGQCHAKADIEILKRGKVIGGAQVKYHKSAASTTLNISDCKYDGLQKVCPSDQTSKVRQLADRRGKDWLGKRNYPDTAKNASNCISKNGVKSDSFSYNKVLDIANNPAKAAKEIVQKESTRVVSGGAIVGGAVSGVLSVAENVAAVIDGEKSAGSAIIAVSADVMSGTADGALKSAATLVAQSGLLRAGAQTLAKSSAPVAVGITAVDVLKDTGLALCGKINGKQLVKRTGKNIVKGGATWGGMEAGATIGTFIWPGIGTIIGGLIGGIGSGFVADMILS